MPLVALLPLLAQSSMPMVYPIACDLRFSGQPAHVIDHPLPASPHTLTFFVRAPAQPAGEAHALVTQLHAESAFNNENYGIFLDETGELIFMLGTAPRYEALKTSGLQLSDGEWHFAAVHFSSEEVVVTVDAREPQRFTLEQPRWINAHGSEEGQQPGAPDDERDPTDAERAGFHALSARDDGESEDSLQPTTRGRFILGHQLHGQIAELLVWSPPLCARQVERLRTAAMGRALCSARGEGEDGAEGEGEGEGEGDDEEVTVAAPAREPALLEPRRAAPPVPTTPVPTHLLRCLYEVTVGVAVAAADGTVTTAASRKTLILEQLVATDAADGLSAECAAVLNGIDRVGKAASRAFSPVGIVGLASDAAAGAPQRPHTHLFTLAKSDPQLLDDATQVLVMGIMAGMIASTCSIVVGLAVGCWAGASLVKSATGAVRPLKLV